MNTILIALTSVLALTMFLPVYEGTFPLYQDRTGPTYFRWRPAESYGPFCAPAEEALMALRGKFFMRGVAATGVPACLALLNLPLLICLCGPIADRWRCLSSLVIGLLSTSLTAQLLARFGYGRLWGGWVIWTVALMLMIAGTVALARLGKTRDLPAT